MHFKAIGLRADNTQGWLAAVGALLVMNRMGIEAQLQWDDGLPVYHGVGKGHITSILAKYLERGSDILDRLPPGIGGKKAPLDLTAGRVNLIAVIKDMLANVDEQKIDEALNTAWKNQDNVTCLGWDIGAVKMAASIGGNNAPDASPHRGVVAAQWLAAESLPITSIGPRKKTYSWVTWSVPLDLGGVRAVAQALSTDWGGVRYEANVGRNGQMGYLEPARIVS